VPDEAENRQKFLNNHRDLEGNLVTPYKKDRKVQLKIYTYQGCPRFA
jgi:hypothetical protein